MAIMVALPDVSVHPDSRKASSPPPPTPLRTSSASPVSEDSLTETSSPWVRTPSAGILSPASSSTTSPTRSWRVDISRISPARTT